MDVEDSGQQLEGGVYRVGSIIDGRYEILGIMGEGATATVYRAQQKHIDRAVALKVLRANYYGDRSSFEARFLREAQLAAQIRHPGVVTIHDFGFTDHERFPFIAMELLKGHDLDAELERNGRLEVQRALKLFDVCLGALGKGHELGIIHRDLKPANLFLSEPGTLNEQLVILDFGIAGLAPSRGEKPLTEEEKVTSLKLTNVGELVGTPCYLAPEYITEQLVTPALDVYQIGLILVEALTGVPVVNDDNVYGCLRTHCNGKLNIPESLLESPLGPVLRQATTLDPTKRYPDAQAFRRALMALDAGEVAAVVSADGLPYAPPSFNSGEMPAIVVETAQFETPSALPSEPRSGRGAVLVALVVLLVVAALGGVWFVSGTSSEDAVPDAAAEARAPAGAAAAEKAEPADPHAAIEAPGQTEPAVAAPNADDTPEAAGEAASEEDDGTAGEVGTAVAAAALNAGDAAVPMVTVRVLSTPKGASVVYEGEVLGATPLDVQVAAGQASRLQLRKRGYHAETVEVSPTENTQVTRRLRRRKAERSDEGKETGGGNSMRIIP